MSQVNRRRTEQADESKKVSTFSLAHLLAKQMRRSAGWAVGQRICTASNETNDEIHARLSICRRSTINCRHRLQKSAHVRRPPKTKYSPNPTKRGCVGKLSTSLKAWRSQICPWWRSWPRKYAWNIVHFPAEGAGGRKIGQISDVPRCELPG